MNGLELYTRTRAALKRLMDGGDALSLSVCQELHDLGWSPRVAWSLVESTLDAMGSTWPRKQR